MPLYSPSAQTRSSTLSTKCSNGPLTDELFIFSILHLPEFFVQTHVFFFFAQLVTYDNNLGTPQSHFS